MTPPRFCLFLVLSIGCLLVQGCNPFKDTTAAEHSVVEFHALYNKKDFDKIYLTSHQAFKAAATKSQFIEFIQAVRTTLGPVKSASKINWRINSFNLKTNVVLTYDTTFETGKGTETFTYRIDKGAAVLLGWNINSRDLIVKKAEQK